MDGLYRPYALPVLTKMIWISSSPAQKWQKGREMYTWSKEYFRLGVVPNAWACKGMGIGRHVGLADRWSLGAWSHMMIMWWAQQRVNLHCIGIHAYACPCIDLVMWRWHSNPRQGCPWIRWNILGKDMQGGSRRFQEGFWFWIWGSTIFILITLVC